MLGGFIEALRAARDTVVVTGTASGKSLCFHLPALERILEEPDATALYLFPTKALAQDQVAELLELNKAGGLGIRAATFDGDTPGDQRQAIRLNGDIVVTNDIPLADRTLKAGGAALGATGKAFTPSSIGAAMAQRDLMEHLRSFGEVGGGPKPFSAQDRSRFLSALDAAVQKAKRR